MGKQKIMFVVCNGAEARSIYPIWEELKRRGIDEIINISTGSISKEKIDQSPEAVLRAFNMPFRMLDDYQTRDITKVLKVEQPDVVVVGSDQEFLKRAFVFAANGLNISTLSLRLGISSNVANIRDIAIKGTMYRLTHNFTNIILKYLYLLRTIVGLGWSPLRIIKTVLLDVRLAFSVDDVGGRFGCRAIAVAGSWEKQVLIERGVDPSNIFVTGNPVFDTLSQVGGSSDTAYLRQDLGIDAQDNIVLLLTSAYVEHGWWSPEMRTTFVTGIIDSLTPFLEKSGHLVIKIHPVENIDDYHKIVDPNRKRVILRRDLKPSEVISISDVVLSGHSTTVLEACALRKPVIVLNIFGEPEYLPYVKMGLATGVYHLSDLKIVVEKLLHDLSFRENALRKVDYFINQNKNSFDGKATSRITDLILELAESPNYIGTGSYTSQKIES